MDLNLNELVKHVPQVAGALVASDFVKRLLTPMADSLGQKMRERIERCFDKAAKANPEFEANFQYISHRVLVPLIQGVALEDDETLHDMWSALLANAASAGGARRVNSGFIAILKQLEPQEAVVLKALYAEDSIPPTPENEFRRHGLPLDELRAHLPRASSPDAQLRALLDFQLSIDALVAHQLIKPTFWSERGGVYTEIDRPIPERNELTYTLTPRGRAFVEACQPPVPTDSPRP